MPHRISYIKNYGAWITNLTQVHHSASVQKMTDCTGLYQGQLLGRIIYKQHPPRHIRLTRTASFIYTQVKTVSRT